MRVTFDSNVWRIVASPQIFPNEPFLKSFKTIRASICNGQLTPCIAETVFTLEALQRSDRKEFLSKYKPKIDFSEHVRQNGVIELSFTIKPNPSLHPRNTAHLSTHLQHALALGFKLLRCPRVANLKNPDIPDSYFLSYSSLADAAQRLEKYNQCLREIEDRGCGIHHIKKIGQKFSPAGTLWFDGLTNMPDDKGALVSKAVAEWADGDAVAAHVGYDNDYFCTRDIGKSAGPDSILSEANRAWLKSKFGVIFATQEELAAILSNISSE